MAVTMASAGLITADNTRQQYAAECVRYVLGDRELYVYRNRLYEVVGRTGNPRAMVVHDGPLLVDGVFMSVQADEGLISGYHPSAGHLGYFDPYRFDYDALKLHRVPVVDAPSTS